MQYRDAIHVMTIAGNAFVRALAEAYSFADLQQRVRLKGAFPETFAFYERQFERHKQRMISERKWV